MHLVQYLVAFLINLVSGIPLIFALDLVSIALAAPEDGFFNPLNIGRRVNKPTDYQGAICNANRALAQIAAGNQPQSTYTDYTALSNNYQLYSANRWPIDGSLDGVFGTLNIHKANFIRWGGDYSPPEGSQKLSFNLWINAQDGMIIVDNAESASRGASIPADVPTRLSDNPNSLRYILRRSVINPYSTKIGKQAVAAAGSKVQEWPATNLLANTDPWRAVIGCPNGYGVGFLLMQHRAVFETRTLGTAWVFESSIEELCFLYSITGGGNALAPGPAAPPAPLPGPVSLDTATTWVMQTTAPGS
ncbi:MAG: hypothetical protein LQ340_005454 [Diploschistes diacapsis]|nr:MAG: hypothetical protein LQ340_005454 [Diploschistes diacapsis]